MLCNQNGELVSVVPTVIKGTVANATTADVSFGAPCFILPAANGSVSVYDSGGTTVTVAVTAGQFFPAMVSGTKAAGSTAIAFSYWR